MVVSPCYVPHIFAGHDRGAGQLPTLGFPRPAYGADTAPPFLCLSGAHFQQSTRIYGTPLRPAVHAYYLRTCGLHPPPAWERAESVCADFAVRHGGTFSFRIVRQKLLYVTYPKLSGPFVEFHKAIFWVGGWDPYSLPLFRIVRRKLLYVVSAEGQRNAAPPYNPVRRSWQHVPGLLGCGFAAQNRKSRLSAAANKSCLKGRPFIIWSCRPAPYGNGQPVCAASTGRADSPACSGGGFRVEFFY